MEIYNLDNEESFLKASKKGYIKYLQNNSTDFPGNIILKAIQKAINNSQTDTLIYLLQIPAKYNRERLSNILKKSLKKCPQVETFSILFNKLYKDDKILFVTNIIKKASKYKCNKIIKYILSKVSKNSIHPDVIGYIAQYGDIELLDIVHNKIGNKFITNSHIQDIAVRGNLDNIKWLMDKGYIVNENIVYLAEKYGYENIIKWGMKQDFTL